MVDFNIELAGFRGIDDSSMAILNRNINNHAKRIAELANKLEKLHVTLKRVHEREKGEKYDIRVKILDNGKVYASHAIDRNLFAAVDEALEKLAHELD
jgi:ribosome-associated translation inhibitor RaiA